MSRNSSGRAFHRLNRNLIIGHMIIAALAIPIAAHRSHQPLRSILIPLAISAALTLLVCCAKPLGLWRYRTALLTAGLFYTSAELYHMNGGIFGTSLEPALLSYGTASLIAVDGRLVSVAIGLACGWGFTLAGKLIFPEIYFSGVDADWPRASAHMIWWALAVLSGYILGGGVSRILRDLEVSRQKLEAAQASERLMEERAASIRAMTASERTATLDAVGETFEQWMRSAVSAVIATTEHVCAEAATTRQIAAAAESVSEDVAQLAEAASRNTDIVAAASVQLSASIGDARRKIADAAAATLEAVGRVRESDAALSELARSSQQIEAVVGLIDNIAGQTNLLALNATIEAARAGEAGRGFAVVAIEVKRLAAQTSMATSEVARLVSGMQAALAAMIGANQSVEHSVSAVNGFARSVSAMMEVQNAATLSIAETVGAMAQGTRDTSARTAQAAAHAGQTARTAQAMLEGAAVLSQDATALQQKAGGFVTQLRAVQTG